jgi:hypothetical protein
VVLIARSPNRYIGSREFCGQGPRMWLRQKGSEHRPLPGLDPRRRGYDPSKCGVVTGLPQSPAVRQHNPADQTLHHRMIVRRYRSQIVSKSIAPQSLDENAASHIA